MTLEDIRNEIDRADGQLLHAFMRRMELSKQIAGIKAKDGLPIRNAAREDEILERVGAESGDLRDYAQALYKTLFALSRDYQKALLGGKSGRNIVLIGMPGCGKTCVGREIARISGMDFVSTDEEIVQMACRSIPEIFETQGEAAFREMERRVILKMEDRRDCVIATGGGSVLHPANYAPLHEHGRIYHITRDIRLLATQGRPLSSGEAALRAMQTERALLYKGFRDACFENNKTVEELAQTILDDFKAHANMNRGI